jgi:hypothetical protein
MKLFQETTKWPDGNSINHAYYMDDAKTKMYAYIRAGDKVAFEFRNPIRIDARGRSFREIPNTVGYFHASELKTVSKEWKVSGSKGETYVVSFEDDVYNCTCTGFKFRGACKHVKEIAGE